MKKLYTFITILLTVCMFSACSKAAKDENSVVTTEDITTYAEPVTEEFSDTGNATEPETTTSDLPDETTSADVTSDEDSRDAYYNGLAKEAAAAGRKIVYLTFDDGSGTLTPTVLDTLDQYGVKATFFVVGSYSLSDEYAKTEYNDILNRGNTLGIHSFTHSRANIYKSIETFSEDCDKMIEYVQNLTGFTPYLWRFPGGSATSFADERMHDEYIPYVESKGLTYYDWNVSSGDGSSKTTEDQIYNNVIEGVKGKSVSVVLMHDGSGHEPSVAALPRILNTLINEMDCVILPITRSTTPVQSQIW